MYKSNETSLVYDMNKDKLVSVVIPNFNGSETLPETLQSVCGQTHRELEIIVVDDGSTDDSVDLIRKHMSNDSRIRVIEQRNSGVAAARNTGWRAATSGNIAFIDSDDLWAPEKIARQFARMSGADQPGLVYAGYTLIDREGFETYRVACPRYEGGVLEEIAQRNFIGNGSSVLVRRSVLEQTSGFEAALHHAKAQGCEDWLFYCRAAEVCRFGVVPENLVGYRVLPNNMSSDGLRMLRSWHLVAEEIGGRHPGLKSKLDSGFRFYASTVAKRALFSKELRVLVSVGAFLMKHCPRTAFRIFALELPKAIGRTLRSRLVEKPSLTPKEEGKVGRRPKFLKITLEPKGAIK